VSESFAEEFKKLQANVKNDDYSIVKPVIEREIGLPLDEVFDELSQTPLASASIAQVHVATLKNGSQVVVKVQHPGIYEEMTMDISLMEKALPLIKHLPAVGMIDPAAVVGELKRSLLNELDFTKEADNIDRFRKNNEKIPYILAPKVYREFSSEKLLIMDYMTGMKVSDYIDKANEQIQAGNSTFAESKKRLANEIVDNYMKQIFDDGFFHADPHPGNILITTGAGSTTEQEAPSSGAGDSGESPAQTLHKEASSPLDVDVTIGGVSLGAVFERQDFFELFAGGSATLTAADAGNAASEKIVYIDFGMMGSLDERTLDKFNNIIAAFSQQDSDLVARAILTICKEKSPINMDDFTVDVNRLFTRYFDMPIGDISLPAIFQDIAKLCGDHKLQLPQSVTLLMKGVGTIEGIVLTLDPELSIMSAVMPYAKRYLRKQFDLKTEVQEFLHNLYKAGKAMPELPVKLSRMLDTIGRGEMKVGMDHTHLDDLFRRFEIMVNRLVMGLIVAALIIGSSMLMNFSVSSSHSVIYILGIVGYLLALVLVITMVLQTRRKRK
ncbi:MAG: ABC1 kinase family protein, partial [Saezia sp.]